MTSDAVARALRKYERLIEHEYGLSLAEILSDKDAAIRAKRLWRATGVVLKTRYAEPVKRRPTPGVKARYRYDIDPAKLRKTLAGNAWEAKLLAELPGRQPDEGVEAFVMRTRTETNHGKKVRAYLCRFVCSDGELQHALERLGVDPGRVADVVKAVPHFVPALEAASKLLPPFAIKDQLMAITALFALSIEGVKSLCSSWNPDQATS